MSINRVSRIANSLIQAATSLFSTLNPNNTASSSNTIPHNADPHVSGAARFHGVCCANPFRHLK
jgi:hypothetical protein